MKNWPIFLGGLLFLLIGTGLLFLNFGGKRGQQLESQKISEIQVQPPEISARPLFSFAPRGDGRAIQISISGISPDLKIDYEITYQTATGVTQGIGGPVALEPGQSFYTREHIFGTCSKNVCTYDQGVENGKWRATIEKGFEVYEIGGSWRLQNIGTKSTTLGFSDQFELEVEAGTFSKSFFVVTSENSSIPKNFPQGVRLVLGPFTILASEPVNFKKPAKVSLVGKNGANFQILQISSSNPNWMFLETSKATATTSAFGTFVLVEKI